MRFTAVLVAYLVAFFYTRQLPAAAPSPAAITFNAWLEAFNSGDAARLLAYWKQHAADSPESHVSRDLQLRAMTGGLRLVKVTSDTGTCIVALMKEGRGGYSESTLDLSSVNPPLIASLSGHPVPPPSGSAPAAADDRQLAALVQAHLDKAAADDRFSGAVLIAYHGKPVLKHAWGLADRERKIPNTVNTQFCLGSSNKMFTAVAILQLVQSGKLSLDEPLATYWPSYPNPDLARRVTIRHLLSHTGGTGDIFTSEYHANRLKIQTLQDYVSLFGNRALSFQPGSRMEYSNYGFILLGRIIELISGESYPQYVQQHIYQPAGMTSTHSQPETNNLPGRSIGYTSSSSGLQPNTETLPWSGTSAGGGYSTVTDLLNFANALQEGKLLSPSLLRQATSDSNHHGYGLGFYTAPDGSYGHGGGAPGMNAETRLIPARGYIIVVLANRDPSVATEAERYIEAALPSI